MKQVNEEIQIPIVEVDRRDYVQMARRNINRLLQETEEAGSVFDTISNLTSDRLEADHLISMLQLSSYLGQPLPRSLDQSYHEYMDTERIERLDRDQVMIRYNTRLKSKSLELVKPASTMGSSVSEQQSRESLTVIGSSPSGSEEGRVDIVVITDDEPQSQAASAPIGMQAQGRMTDGPMPEYPSPSPDIKPQSPNWEASVPYPPQMGTGADDFITVPHFWIFKLNSGMSQPPHQTGILSSLTIDLSQTPSSPCTPNAGT